MKDKDKSKINNKNIFFVDLQLFFTIVTIILLIWFFFNQSIVIYVELFLGLSLISMGINNHLIYKRKYFTVIYFLLGVVVLLNTILSFLGV